MGETDQWVESGEEVNSAGGGQAAQISWEGQSSGYAALIHR